MGDLRGFFGKSFSAFGLGKIKTFEKHGELGAGQMNVPIFGGDEKRQTVSTFFETLVPYCKTIVVPIEYLDAVASSIEEKEKCWRKRVGVKGIADQTEEAVEGNTHVDRVLSQKKGGVRREVDHGWFRVWMSRTRSLKLS